MALNRSGRLRIVRAKVEPAQDPTHYLTVGSLGPKKRTPTSQRRRTQKELHPLARSFVWEFARRMTRKLSLSLSLLGRFFSNGSGRLIEDVDD